MAAPADYKNKFLKKPPKRIAVVDQNSCSGCANSPACVAFCETVTVKDSVVDAIRYISSPDAPNNLAIIEPEKCIGCALCAEVCPWDAITMYNFDESFDASSQVTLIPYSPELDVNPKPEQKEETAPVAAPAPTL
ncbi:MAG TPA: 4Fe-4S dicluster domain-containing protein [Candidatus Polarisedimenticolia bacterium]|nr:4Fe-4S dicluster domain-containing protein [Candidatus Polarisedimenticolia bacterium]